MTEVHRLRRRGKGAPGLGEGEERHRSITMVCERKYERPQLEEAEVLGGSKDWTVRLGEIMVSIPFFPHCCV